MRLFSYLQKIGVGLIVAVLCLGVMQGVVMANGAVVVDDDSADEEMTFTEDEITEINNVADKKLYQCEKYVKLCPENKAEFNRPDLRLECAICREYLKGTALEDYKKYFYYDFNSNFEFDDVGANSEQKLVEAAMAKANGGDSDGDGIPDEFDNCPDKENPKQLASDCPGGTSKYGYYIGQRDTTGDVPNSSEFFPVNTLTAPGQVGFFEDTSGNPVLDFIVRMMGLLVYMIGLAALVVIVIGAYFLLTAAGDDEQLSKGKDVIKLGLTGMVIVIFAYMIVTFVQALIY